MKKILAILASIAVMITILIVPAANAFADSLNSIENEQEQQQDIVGIAIGDGRFTILVNALKAADLVDTLKGPGPFTVFAPTDTAFKKLPADTLEGLLKAENKDTLKAILLYHVNKGELTSKDIKALNGKEITSANGEKATISVKDGDVYINGSKVIIFDINASNGVIHVIDTVLIPNDVSKKL